MRVTFHGAAGTVTGSKYLVETESGRYLVDCGLFQGLKQLRLRNRQPLPFPAGSIGAVILTHAHLDHSGYLPLLLKNGFRGRVFCTPPTIELCAVPLPDSGHLQEEEAEAANRYGYSKHNPALPLYPRQDAVQALESFESVQFGEDFTLPGGDTLRLTRSGHMLGSAMVRISGGTGSIVFTGDLGRPEDPLLLPAESIREADHLVVESTYGDRLHSETAPMDALAGIVSRTAARGGAVRWRPLREDPRRLCSGLSQGHPARQRVRPRGLLGDPRLASTVREATPDDLHHPRGTGRRRRTEAAHRGVAALELRSP